MHHPLKKKATHVDKQNSINQVGFDQPNWICYPCRSNIHKGNDLDNRDSMIVWMMSMVAASVALAVAGAVAQGKYIFIHFTRPTKLPIYEWCYGCIIIFLINFFTKTTSIEQQIGMPTIKEICKSKNKIRVEIITHFLMNEVLIRVIAT